jgi:peroxiredoxin
VLLTLAAFLLLPGASLAVQVGDTAPPFSLLDLNGQTQTLSNLAGNVVVLFFLGHNAAACQEPGRTLETTLRQEYEGRPCRILGIDCWNGTADQLKAYRSASGAGFPLLLSGREVAASYDLAYNSFVVIDAKGIVRYVSPGPEPSAFSLDALRAAVRTSIADAAAVSAATWGAIKTLYSGQRRWPVTGGSNL